jgi:hypothetical protein
LHEAYIIKEGKVKEIEIKLKEKEKKGAVHQEEINEYTINQLEDEIREL